MNVTTSCRWIITLSLAGTALVGSAVPAHPQSGGSSGGGSGSIGSSSGGNHGMTKPGSSRNTNPDGITRGTGPSSSNRSNPTPNQTQPDRMQALENSLREGHMDPPVAQGQISDRLDQFYRDSDRLTGDATTGQPGR